MCPLPQRSSNQPVDYARLNKELDEREAYVRECEKALSKAKHDIKVLDTTLESKQHQLDLLNQEITNQTSNHKDIVHGLQLELKSIKANIEKRQLALHKSEEAIVAYTRRVAGLQHQIASLDSESKERKRYLKEQEVLVNEALEEGNLKLRQLKYEIEDLATQKQTVNLELMSLSQKRSELVDSIGFLSVEHNNTEREINEQIASLRLTLSNLNAQIKIANVNLEASADKANKKLAQLKEKEESIVAKQNALRKERSEFELEKRRFDSTRNLYDL